MIITIDGPTASGKSSVARALAKLLNYHCLSSGLLYRGLAYILVNKCGYTEQNLYDPRKHDIDKALCALQFVYPEGAECGLVLIDGKDVSADLKTSIIDKYASVVATSSLVRHVLDDLQRTIADNRNIVAEGRDMGTVVFPFADIKFFLTASPEIRAQRWQADQHKKNNTVSVQEALRIIQERDTRDSQRSIAPLAIAKDAIVIDNSSMTVPQTVHKMMEYIVENKKK
jgi:cytidylate kinase